METLKLLRTKNPRKIYNIEMDLFKHKHILGREFSLAGLNHDSEFKLFVERRMREEGGRFACYADETVLNIMEKEFSLYKHAAPGKKGEVKAQKSKVPSYKSIATALSTAEFGQKFTTPQSDRIYVITKGTWGKKSKNKVVKGFETGGDEVDTFSKRTKVKHGGKSPNSLPKGERTPSMTKR